MSANWETLVAKCCPADARICNCRQAYETHKPGDVWRCAHGCSAAQCAAKEIVATAVLEGKI